jgi:hypothetical protein
MKTIDRHYNLQLRIINKKIFFYSRLNQRITSREKLFKHLDEKRHHE